MIQAVGTGSIGEHQRPLSRGACCSAFGDVGSFSTPRFIQSLKCTEKCPTSRLLRRPAVLAHSQFWAEAASPPRCTRTPFARRGDRQPRRPVLQERMRSRFPVRTLPVCQGSRAGWSLVESESLAGSSMSRSVCGCLQARRGKMSMQSPDPQPRVS